ncbi:hypothetical protein [Streptomyces sp. NPDC056628]|uniref:hypothetical protein n=1 Tax=Streptomyces sp. NPDC056628 TaxID=3345882 RepID=UPI00369B63F1
MRPTRAAPAAGRQHDGHVVASVPYATNLAPGDPDDDTDLFVRDLHTGADVLATPNRDGDPGQAVDARTHARARTVAFSDFDDERFVPGDTNGVQDVFVRRLSGSKYGNAPGPCLPSYG